MKITGFRKKFGALFLTMVLLFTLGGCGGSAESTTAAGTATTTAATQADNGSEGGRVRIGSLKGPTTMGLVNLMKASEEGNARGKYTFTMETQPDVIAAGVISGDYDIALVPANLAAVLYKKTEGKVKVISINTGGVLECVSGDKTIVSVKDLAGKTVYSTGQGATPEYALKYLLEKNGVTDCTIEFKSEATEIASLLSEDPNKIAVLPQPFATVAKVQNEMLSTAFSLSEEWDALGVDSQLITGLTIVRTAFLEENPEAVKTFLEEAAASVEKAATDVDKTAELVVEYGIIEKAPIAKKALPFCNICAISGADMKTTVSAYLQTLYDQNAASVGGAMPAEDFYYIGE